MLKMTKVELKLVTDADMFKFFEKGSKDNISYITYRYSKANNEYLKSYDLKEELTLFILLDTNNLFGYAKSKFLPRGGFKQIDPKDFDLNKYTSNSAKACVLKVDLEYPKELHELHNDYPLAPDKIEIKRDEQG